MPASIAARHLALDLLYIDPRAFEIVPKDRLNEQSAQKEAGPFFCAGSSFGFQPEIFQYFGHCKHERP